MRSAGPHGKRVENGYATYYLRSSVLGGQVVCEMNSGGGWTRGYVYLGGQMLAMQFSGVFWLHQEPYSKGQRITNSSGNVTATIELDPWGGETNRSVNSYFQPRKFTTYDRDANYWDEAQARQYHGFWSRFAQPDPYDGSYSPTNPQSFNRYAYVQNDPVNFVDPSGLEMCVDAWCGGGGYWGPRSFGGNLWGNDPHPGGGNIAARDHERTVAVAVTRFFKGLPKEYNYIGGLSWGYWGEDSGDVMRHFTATFSVEALNYLTITLSGRFAFDISGTLWGVHGEAFGEGSTEIDWNAQLMMAAPFAGILRNSAGEVEAQIGSKLEYLFGKATGEKNLARTVDMLKKMQGIGIFDTVANRAYLQGYFNSVLRNSANVVFRQANGTTVRESLLMGPSGGLKMTSFWQGDRLMSFILYGGGP
jgi:RHS repeat-associated protein